MPNYPANITAIILGVANGSLPKSALPDDFVCTVDICPIQFSAFNYRPSLGFNAALLALFTLSTIGFLAIGIWKKTWGFMVAMTMGGVLEIIGYIGRVAGHVDPFNALGGNAFLIQICTLTIAPACYAAGIYLCLSRIVTAFGADISRLPPKAYTIMFILFDLVSLILQAAGGALASLANTREEEQRGTHIMLGGLSWQVFTLTVFMILCADFAYRVMKNKDRFTSEHTALRRSMKFKAFIVALGVSTILIYVRCVYRVAELAEGWNGYLISHEVYFLVLEGLMVVLAVLVLNVFHPGLCFSESYAAPGKKLKWNGEMNDYERMSNIKKETPYSNDGLASTHS